MLTPEQRAKIRELTAQGVAKAEIARRLKVSRDSVYRVLKSAPGQERGEAPAAPPAVGRNRGHLAHLFEVFEDLRSLTTAAVGLLPALRVLDQFDLEIPDGEHKPGSKQWVKICLKLATCFEDISRLVHELRLDTPTFHRLYLEMLDARSAWMRFMSSSEPVEEEEEVTWYQAQLPQLDRIIGNLKKLIIGTR